MAPEAYGVDSAHLADMLAQINDTDLNIDAIMIVRDGQPILEAYSHPMRDDMPHVMWSTTKSVTSMLVGIAIDEGHIPSVDAPMLDFFSQAGNPEQHNPEQRPITVAHLLSMTAGVEWDEWLASYGSEANSVRKFAVLDEPVSAFLNLKVVEPPGNTFDYCTGCTDMLMAIIDETVSDHEDTPSARQYAESRLLTPLQIDNFVWDAYPEGLLHGGYGLWLTLRDFVRLGELYLNNGVWEGEQIVPADWVALSTQKHVEFTSDGFPGIDGYGYGWWTLEDGGYVALGSRGQMLAVLPQYDAVIGIFSGLSLQTSNSHLQLLRDHIIPALASDTLPENPDAVTRLEVELDRFVGLTPQPLDHLPAQAEAISGKVIDLEENPTGINQLTLTFDDLSEVRIETVTAGRTFTSVAGLDGTFHTRPENESGGAKGAWIHDNTFEIIWRDAHSGTRLYYRLLFLGDAVTFFFTPPEGRGFRVQGTIQD